MTETPLIRSADATHVLAVWRGHVLGRWDGIPKVAAAEQFEQLLLELVEAQPNRTAYIAVLPASLALPAAEVRDVFVRAGSRVGSRLACIAVVIEGSGFQATAMRAMVTGIGIMARARFPLRCLGSLEEAAQSAQADVSRAGGQVGTPQELRDAFELLRTHMTTMR